MLHALSPRQMVRLTFGNTPCMQAQMSGRELQRLLKQKGLRVQVSSCETNPDTKLFELFVMVTRPNTPYQVTETLKQLEAEGFVAKDGKTFMYEGLPVRLGEQLEVQELGLVPRLEVDTIDFRKPEKV